MGDRRRRTRGRQVPARHQSGQFDGKSDLRPKRLISSSLFDGEDSPSKPGKLKPGAWQPARHSSHDDRASRWPVQSTLARSGMRRCWRRGGAYERRQPRLHLRRQGRAGKAPLRRDTPAGGSARDSWRDRERGSRAVSRAGLHDDACRRDRCGGRRLARDRLRLLWPEARGLSAPDRDRPVRRGRADPPLERDYAYMSSPSKTPVDRSTSTRVQCARRSSAWPVYSTCSITPHPAQPSLPLPKRVD